MFELPPSPSVVEFVTDETGKLIIGGEEIVSKSYQCGVCGEFGHNARTCPARAGNSPFEPTVGSEITETVKPKTYKSEVWQTIETVAPHARLMLLYGPPGTGKTTAANRLGDPGDSLYNVTLTEETPAAELRGHYIPKGGEFVWSDGPALRAFRQGARLVLNEIDKASSDALSFCHALLDDPGVSAITLPTGETVIPHEAFNVIATMNGIPEDLPEAIRSRFAISFNVHEPHPGAILSLPEELREAAVQSIESDPDRTIGFREWKAYAFLSTRVSKKVAAQAVFGARATEILNTIKLAGARNAKG